MQRIELDIHGGGRLEVHGSLENRRILILLSRESFEKDDPIIARLIAHFASERLTIARYESRGTVTLRLIDRKWFRGAPLPLRNLLKAIHLVFFPTRWRHFSARHRSEINAIPYRCESLRDLIRFLGPGKEIVFLTRSAGGRVASLIADEMGVSKLVCLGYPFRDPKNPPEPARYEHLADLKTPFLIIQGTDDSYGGREVLNQYPFSKSTRFEWIETGHDFSVSPQEWDRVLRLISSFIGEKTGDFQNLKPLA